MPSSRLLLLAVLVAAGCTAAPRPTPAPQPSAPSGAPTDTAAFEALFRARRDSAMRRFTPADVAFMSGMIHHHAQALAMAALAVPNDAGPAVRTLAARITNAQRDEIANMQRWLRDRRQPVPELHEMGGAVMVHGGEHGTMPGMLTPAQMDTLRAARGAAFDRRFLTYMIQHHRGAVAMVQALFASDGAGNDEAAYKIASDAQVDQATEIARMERMLAELPPAR